MLNAKGRLDSAFVLTLYRTKISCLHLVFFYLELDGSRTYEEQWVTVPDVDVHGVIGQVAKERALLSWPQETLIYSELDLQTRRT